LDDEIVAARIFQATVSMAAAEGAAMTGAINQAFSKTTAELIPWALVAM
jgi:ABC-type uncharacterized transport system auxiliary subunit